MVLVARKTLPVHTLADVIAYAKAHKGKTTMGSAGIGSISHLTLLLFNHLTGADVVHVPYRGLSEATTICLAARSICCSIRSSPRCRISSGGENAHRGHDPEPLALAAECAVGESKPVLPQLQTVAWTALFMPKDTPAPIIERINAAVQKAMGDPAISKRLAQIGADIPPPDQRSPEALGHLVAAEIDKWVPLIKAAGVTH